MKKKTCPKCDETKEISKFGKCTKRKDGRQPYCKQCRKAYADGNKDKLAKYHQGHRQKESYKQWHTEYVDKNADRIKETKKEYRLKLKREAFAHYGGSRCSCCGEGEELFLAIDHINGGGTKHRRKIGMGGQAIYHWLKKNDYPDGFQVLCHNCNWGKHINGGICPHKRKLKKELAI